MHFQARVSRVDGRRSQILQAGRFRPDEDDLVFQFARSESAADNVGRGDVPERPSTSAARAAKRHECAGSRIDRDSK